MLRITALSVIVFFLCVYAWKDWFKSLCGLVLLMAILEHPDMPKTMLDVPGLNLWNILFLNVFGAWLVARRKEGLTWDAPGKINWLLFSYLLFTCVGTIRLIMDDHGVAEYASLTGADRQTGFQYASEYIINSVKFVVPGLLIFDGARSRSRVIWAATAMMAMYFFLALLVIKAMGISGIISGDDLQRRALKVLSANVGYHRVNLAMMLSGSFWALYSYRELIDARVLRIGLLLACAITIIAIGLTGGRTGYFTWAVLAIILSTFGWRKLLLLAPIFALVIVMLVPTVVERMLFGIVNPADEESFVTEQFIDEQDIDMFDVLSGRNLAWPMVIEKIKKAPFIGYGREAMQNAGISTEMAVRYGRGEAFPHPHNAYLQWALDNGIVALFFPLMFFYLIMRYSLSLFRDTRRRLFVAVGGIGLSLVGAFLIASFGSQSFYPREGSVGMWCAIGLTLRLYVERAKYGVAIFQRSPRVIRSQTR